ncbi:MAG: HepT-like ribonuclease domain-containing protein [Bacteroidota bacterium]|nr:HepT-like ribonuclease domain-containing protein [Bacteroidota bacterium]
MNRIEEYLHNIDFKKFKRTYLIVDATIRNFEIIGEASKNIPIEIQEKHPEIPWKKCMDFETLSLTNILELITKLIWEIAKVNLPRNKSDLEKIIRKKKHGVVHRRS